MRRSFAEKVVIGVIAALSGLLLGRLTAVALAGLGYHLYLATAGACVAAYGATVAVARVLRF